MTEHIIVVKLRDYRLTIDQMTSIIVEWEGQVVEMIGGNDDIHVEFAKSEHAKWFRHSLIPFRI